MQSKPRKIELFLFLLVLFIALTSIYYLGASITAFIIKELGYEQKLNLVITSNGNYTWYIDNVGDLKSLKIDGSITHYGKAKVYLESKGIKYLILDTTKLNNTNFSSISLINQTNLITAFVVKDKQNKTIDKNEKPKWSSGVNEFVVNDTTKINLSEHFTDDDNDSLSYSVSQAEGLSTFLEHEILIITPTATENLNTTINLTASDGIDNKTKEIGLIIIVSIGQNETINLTPITNKTRFITIALDYKSGTAYDEDDDGKESINGVIDLSIENTYFNWDVDKNKLCTRWEVY
ncbi:hypothetical protein HYW99_01200, partial [Candidatus Woesearchaeota archaeon]|nr:hypothetical protein [Candidatus Woesearchaeota archaeon]